MNRKNIYQTCLHKLRRTELSDPNSLTKNLF